MEEIPRDGVQAANCPLRTFFVVADGYQIVLATRLECECQQKTHVVIYHQSRPHFFEVMIVHCSISEYLDSIDGVIWKTENISSALNYIADWLDDCVEKDEKDY